MGNAKVMGNAEVPLTEQDTFKFLIDRDTAGIELYGRLEGLVGLDSISFTRIGIIEELYCVVIKGVRKDLMKRVKEIVASSELPQRYMLEISSE
jgi:hypothetical protein